MQGIEKLQKRLNTAKTSIILVAVLTLINIISIAFNAKYSFPFSAYIPQLVTAIFGEAAAEQGTNNQLYIGIAIAVIMVLIYVALWLGARKKNGFIIVALVLFSIDTALLLYDVLSYLNTSFIIDIAFHAWVIYDLILGIVAYSKLKKIPVEEMQQNSEQVNYYNPCPQNAEDNSTPDDSSVQQ
ncbi:MAG: hypothetical protein K2K42_00855 [Eubacterium sp.]|nr:hypothetical protein [Eubacterium sp.]